MIATARYGTVIYAAVRSSDGAEVFGLVLLAERRDGVLCTKPVSEDMGRGRTDAWRASPTW